MNNSARKTILLVEDEAILAMVQAQTVSQFGYNVITSGTGEQAIQIAASDQTINLVLMDIDLGKGIDGTEAARQILAKRNVPIVFLTSHSEKEYVDKVKEITRYGYIIKDSGDFVLQSSIEMAFELFDAHRNIQENMKALQKSEERFRHLTDLLPQSVFETDIKGNYTYVNQFGLKLMGYSHDDIEAGINMFSLLVPEDLERAKVRYKEVLNGSESSARPYTVVRKNGEALPVILYTSPIIENGQPTGLRGIVIDITERKQSKEKVKELEARYYSLVDQLPAGVFRKDLEGHYVYVSPWFCKLKKMHAVEFLGKTAQEVAKSAEKIQGAEGFAVKYARDGYDHHKRIIQDGISIEGEEEYTDAEGTKQYVYSKKFPVMGSDGKIIGSQAILFDITERKQIEETLKLKNEELAATNEELMSMNEEYEVLNEELIATSRELQKSNDDQQARLDISERILSEEKMKELEARYYSLVDQLPAGVFRKDLEGRYTFVSPWYCRLWEVNAEDCIGKTPLEVASRKAENQKVEDWFVRIASDGADHHEMILNNGKSIEIEEEHIDADGKKKIALVKKTPILDSDGKIIGTQGILFDITERKQIEEDLKLKNEELEVLNKELISTTRALQKSHDDLLASEEKFKNIFEFSPVGKSITSIDGKLKTNSAYCQILGYDENELSNLRWQDITYPDDVAYSEQIAREILSGEKKSAHWQKRYIHKNGNTIWADIHTTLLRDKNNSPLYFITTIVDITERKHAEEALQQRVIALSRPLDSPEGIQFSDLFNIDDIQRIQDVFAEATNVASIITHPDGTPITRPSNFCRLCKDIIRTTEKGLHNCFRSDSVIGRQITDGPIIQPCLSGGLWDAGASIVIGGKHIANWLIGQVRNDKLDETQMLEYADVIGADRKEFQQALSEVPVMSEEQFTKVAKSLFTFARELSLIAYQNVLQARFISDQKLADDKIKALLAEKELMIKEAHHRIKNNMNTVVGLLSLQSSTLKDPAASEALKVARGRVQSLMILYDKLYRSEDFKQMSVKEYLSPLVDEIIGNFPNRDSIRIEKQIDEFIIDAKFLMPIGIIVNELITNAIKYSFIGRDHGVIQISAAWNNKRTTLVVEDNGIGLPESISTSNSTGFGLKLVGMLTTQINGTITIERGNGTRFILTF
jgi:PAS domain S-box-containing protein